MLCRQLYKGIVWHTTVSEKEYSTDTGMEHGGGKMEFSLSYLRNCAMDRA